MYVCAHVLIYTPIVHLLVMLNSKIYLVTKQQFPTAKQPEVHAGAADPNQCDTTERS